MLDPLFPVTICPACAEITVHFERENAQPVPVYHRHCLINVERDGEEYYMPRRKK